MRRDKFRRENDARCARPPADGHPRIILYDYWDPAETIYGEQKEKGNASKDSPGDPSRDAIYQFNSRLRPGRIVNNR